MKTAVRMFGGFASNTEQPFGYARSMLRLPCCLFLAAQPSNNHSIYRPGFGLNKIPITKVHAFTCIWMDGQTVKLIPMFEILQSWPTNLSCALFDVHPRTQQLDFSLFRGQEVADVFVFQNRIMKL